MSVAGSDCWVGSILVPLYGYTSGGASVISVFSIGFLRFMYFCSVVCNDATSFYSGIMVATNLVWFNV